MTSVTITLSDEHARGLERLAAERGVSTAELARAGLEEWPCQSRSAFERAAEHVLAKNRELYRRLT